MSDDSEREDRLDELPNATVDEPSSELVASFAAFRFAGPLPPPAILAQYNNVVPGGAKRIFALAEKQADHRRHLERTVVEGNTRAQSRGQLFGFVIGLVGLIGGFWLVYLGHSALGIAAILADLAALAGVFVVGRYMQREERQEKRGEIASQPELRGLFDAEEAADE